MNDLHVAIIMDGNGRWAQARGHARYYGHVRGAKRVRDVVETAGRLGIGALTLYAFSTENWKRPEEERRILWRLLDRYLKGEIPALKKSNVRLRVIGDRSRLTPELRRSIDLAEKELGSCSGLKLTLAISYGGRDDILRGVKSFAQECIADPLLIESLNEERFAAFLDTSYLGVLSNVDLIIRTSGEQRLSNFLLWQSAYSELIFVDKSWPEFSADDFRKAMNQFSGRLRRYGDTDQAIDRAPLVVEAQ